MSLVPLWNELAVDWQRIDSYGETGWIAAFQKSGIRTVFNRADDPLLTIAHRDRVRGAGFTWGLMFALPGSGDPIALATDVSTRVGDFEPTLVILQLETKARDYVVQLLTEYRRRRPLRPTAACMSGHQDELDWPYRTAVALRVGILPECYDGAMNVFDPRATVDFCVLSGAPREWVRPFLAADKLDDYGWRVASDKVAGAVLFSAETLPR